jgi:hypothetical protein
MQTKNNKSVLSSSQGAWKVWEYPLAVAVIDNYYKDHPELLQQPLAEMLTKALTAPGTACEGKSPN